MKQKLFKKRWKAKNHRMKGKQSESKWRKSHKKTNLLSFWDLISQDTEHRPGNLLELELIAEVKTDSPKNSDDSAETGARAITEMDLTAQDNHCSRG